MLEQAMGTNKQELISKAATLEVKVTKKMGDCVSVTARLSDVVNKQYKERLPGVDIAMTQLEKRLAGVEKELSDCKL